MKISIICLLVLGMVVVAHGSSVSSIYPAPMAAETQSGSPSLLNDMYGQPYQPGTKPPQNPDGASLASSFQAGNPVTALPTVGCDQAYTLSDLTGDPPSPSPLTPLPVPEPSTLLLGFLGLGGIVALTLRRQ